MQLPTGDTNVCRESYEIALLAARAAIQAAESARIGEPYLSAMRPPGHHAEPGRGMGFCMFNNIAIATTRARAQGGAVLIADFDYHHGNGTQAWVERELTAAGAPIGFISTHAFPAYPGTGPFSDTRFASRGFVVDIPLPHSTNTDDFVAIWSSLLPPLAHKLRPKTILVSAGFDFLAGDPIAGLPVSIGAVEALSRLLWEVSIAQDAPLVFILEGGYDLDNMRNSGRRLSETLAGSVPGPAYAAPTTRSIAPKDPRLAAMVREVLASA